MGQPTEKFEDWVKANKAAFAPKIDEKQEEAAPAPTPQKENDAAIVCCSIQ